MASSTVAQDLGFKSQQEDMYETENDFAAVFDGHGGYRASEYLSYFFSPKVAKLRESGLGLEESLRGALGEMDKEILAHRFCGEGSTALAVVKEGDNITTANVGDCRAVLSRDGVAVDLTRDHKPEDPLERARIEAVGGTVDPQGEMDENGKPVPGRGIYRVNNGLGVARTIGYSSDRPAVSPEPEIKTVPLGDDDQFVLVASDGIWDFLSSQDAISAVHAELEKEDVKKKSIPQCVINLAKTKGSFDNLTVVIMWLK